MTIPTWPLTLPQAPQKGFTETVGYNIIRSTTDMGPAKQRKRSRSPNILDVNFIMTSAQVAILETFVDTDLVGVRRFLFKHPRTSTMVEVRFVPTGGGLYKSQYLAPGYWTITTQFEILP